MRTSVLLKATAFRWWWFTSPTWFNRRRPRRNTEENPFRSALFIKASEAAYFAKRCPDYRDMPHFKQLLDKHKSVVVETAKFIKLPEEVGTSFCTKGVVVIGSSNGVVLVCELVIEHPGTLISGIGVNMGLHYRWQESRLERATNDDDCPCGNVLRHDHHLGVLESIEWALANRRVRRVSKLSLEVRE